MSRPFRSPFRSVVPLARTRRVGLPSLLLAAGGFAAASLLAPAASAFCGFYVAGADTSLYANATMVVLMRDGTQTVISMQNNYQGPPEDFAMIVPVPTVVGPDQVNTLPKEVFQRVDQLGAPRLVEYFEDDPCRVLPQPVLGGIPGAPSPTESATANGVTVEAEFQEGEYHIVILSAEDSTGLETYLTTNGYNIPAGSAAALEPYVAAQTKFFVAEVDPLLVAFENGQAVLSPLRIAYESPDFTLPIRLGLLNSMGTQDLIVNILARDRYEAANYPNVLVPTNIRVRNQVSTNFGGFYRSLFDEVATDNPGAVVTEYAWNAGSCDPCPTAPLDSTDLATLGADVVFGLGTPNDTSGGFLDVTLTRLHFRYTPESVQQDLQFAAAPPIVGGRGAPDELGLLETTVNSDFGVNNFQGRYIILHPWTGDLTCDATNEQSPPQRGLWGGPGGMFTPPMTQGSMNTALSGMLPAAIGLPVALAEPVLGVTPELALDPLVDEVLGVGASTPATGPADPSTVTEPSTATNPTAPTPPSDTPALANPGLMGSSGSASSSSGCSVSQVPSTPRAGWGALVALGAVFAFARRRKDA